MTIRYPARSDGMGPRTDSNPSPARVPATSTLGEILEQARESDAVMQCDSCGNPDAPIKTPYGTNICWGCFNIYWEINEEKDNVENKKENKNEKSRR